MGIIDQMRTGFGRSTMLMKIIWINIGVFVLLRVAAIVCMFAGRSDVINVILRWVELPSQSASLLLRPWTLLTYMFAQYDVLHILFNMLWLYWFGTLLRMSVTPRQMLALYIYGGIGGGVLFLLAYNFLPLFAHTSGMLIGSSAAVIAIVTATAILMPDLRMRLFLIGSVSLKWIAVATIVLVLIGVTGSNAGGEIAHLGGVGVGALFALNLRRGRDITRPLCSAVDKCVDMGRRLASMRLPLNKSKYSTRGSRNCGNGAPTMPESDRRELDSILEKIKKSGYSALTPDERKRLFDVSRNIRT